MTTSKTKTEDKTEAKEVTAAEKIWDKIKDLPLEIFALPNQVVQDHVKREAQMEKAIPDAVHLILKSAAVLPALEESLGKVRLGRHERFEVTQYSKYTVVKIVPKD